MTERLRRLPPGDLSEDQRVVYDAITAGPRGGARGTGKLMDGDGGLYGPFNAMLRSPAVGNALQALGAAIRYQSGLTDRIREMAVLMVAARYDCAFERWAHEAAARGLGLTEADVASLGSAGASLVLEDPAEAVAMRCVRVLLDRGDLDDPLYAEAVGVLGEQELFELSTLVGYYTTLALQLRLFRVGVPSRS